MLRSTTGATALDETVRFAAGRLAEQKIPHVIVGGLAVQQHGYYPVTTHAEIVVPDLAAAREQLAGARTAPFAPDPDNQAVVRERKSGVQVALRPGGQVAGPGRQVPFPTPTVVSAKPVMAELDILLSLLLDSWQQNPSERYRDKLDAAELITRNGLARDFAVHTAVRGLYQELWDALRTLNNRRLPGQASA